MGSKKIKKNKANRNKKYIPLRQYGWAGYGYIEYLTHDGSNYKLLFEVRFDHLDKEIRKDDAFGDYVIDALNEFAKDDGITSEAINLKMINWVEWYK